MDENEPIELSPTEKALSPTEKAPEPQTPAIDPTAPCPYFPRFLNGLLNLSHKVVVGIRKGIAKLPAPLSGFLAAILLSFGGPLAILLIHLPLALGFAMFVAVYLFEIESAIGLGFITLFAAFILQVVVMLTIGIRVRGKAKKGAVRVYNSYLEIIGNSILFIVAFWCLCIIAVLAQASGSASGGNMSNIIAVSLFAFFVLAASIAILVYSSWKRNRHLGWKTALAVFLTKYVVTWFSWLCVNRIFTAIDRILHPVGEREALRNRIYNEDLKRNGGYNLNFERSRTQVTNTVAETAILGIFLWLLKVTLDPLVTGRPEGEPNGFSAALQDFKAWRKRNGVFFLVAVLSMTGIIVAGDSLLLPKLFTKMEKIGAVHQVKESEDTSNRLVLSAVGKAIGDCIPVKAIPPVGTFKSADDYLLALMKKGCFTNLPHTAAKELCNDSHYKDTLVMKDQYAGKPADEERPDPSPERYAESFEKSGLFSASDGGLPPILRIWRVLAGGTDEKYSEYGGARRGYPLLFSSNLEISIDDMMRYDLDQSVELGQWTKFVRTGSAVAVVYNYDDMVGGALCDTLEKKRINQSVFFGTQRCPNSTEDFEILNPTVPFDSSIIERLVRAAQEAAMADKKAVEQTKADEKKAKAKEAMAFFDDGEKDEAGEGTAKEAEAGAGDESTNSPPEAAPTPQPEPQNHSKPEEAAPPKAETTSKAESMPEQEQRRARLERAAEQAANRVRAGEWTAEEAYRKIRAAGGMTDSEKSMFCDMLAKRGITEKQPSPSPADANAAEEAKRADEEAEKKRIADEAEKKRIADEAEKKRIAEEAEKKRIAEEAEKKRIAEEEAKRKAEEAEKKKEEFDRKQKLAEEKRLAAQEEARKKRDEAVRLAKEREEQEKKAKEEKERETQKEANAILEEMRKLTQGAALGQEGEEEEEEREDGEDNALDRRILELDGKDELLKTLKDAENQRRAAMAEMRKRMEEEQSRRQAEDLRRQTARDAEAARIREEMARQEAAMQAEMAMPRVIADPDEPEARPQRRLGSAVTFPQSTPAPAVQDQLAAQLAQGLYLSIQSGQMTPAQASMLLKQATLTEEQKTKVREILASLGVSLAK